MTVSDVDEFTGLMEGWESDWRQLESGMPYNDIQMMAGRDTVLQRVSLSHAVHQQGKAPEGLVTFGLPEVSGPSLWRGREHPKLAIYDFNSASGYDCVSGSGFCGLTLSFPRQKFIALAERYELDAALLLDGRVWDLRLDECRALLELQTSLSSLVERLQSAPETSGQDKALGKLLERFPDRLLAAMAMSASRRVDQPLRGRQRGLRKAIEFMEQNCHLNPSIPEVSCAAALSWRSLDRASRESFGIGPKRYLLNLRLTRARRDLKARPEGTKVVDVANNWGFWHMGDFAREYQKMFNELPAQTSARQD